MSETVKNVGTHPVDLSDGRPLGPGETADDVALGNAHNKDLLDQGHIAVVGGVQPGDVPPEELNTPPEPDTPTVAVEAPPAVAEPEPDPEPPGIPAAEPPAPKQSHGRRTGADTGKDR